MSDGTNIEALRKLYKTNAVARSFMDHAAQRERDRAETTVERTMAVLSDHGTEAARGDVVAMFQEFERLGCGKFIVGRWNKQSRFAWSVGLISVGKAAAGEQQTVAEVPETTAQSGPEAATICHKYYLRTSTCIEITLPIDLTSHEADRLSAFIKTLPMEMDDTD